MHSKAQHSTVPVNQSSPRRCSKQHSNVSASCRFAAPSMVGLAGCLRETNREGSTVRALKGGDDVGCGFCVHIFVIARTTACIHVLLLISSINFLLSVHLHLENNAATMEMPWTLST